jgi:hypothetical protein
MTPNAEVHRGAGAPGADQGGGCAGGDDLQGAAETHRQFFCLGCDWFVDLDWRGLWS